MSFAGYEDYVAGLRHCCCGADGFAAVYDGDGLSALRFVQAREHIIYNSLRLFKARVVARDDHAVATVGCFLGHQGALALISIAAGAANCNHLRLAAHDFIYRREHVGQSIRRVSIVNDCTHAFWGANGFKAPIDGVERRKYAQRLFR